MFKSSSSRLVSRAGASAIFAVAMSLSNVAASQAMSITPDSVNPWQHIVDCWGAMVSGDPVHATECSPGQPGSNTTLVTPVPGGGSGSPPCKSVPTVTRAPLPSEIDSYKLASLDDSIAPSAVTSGTDVHVAVTCGGGCPVSSIWSPASSSYDLASLDDSIAPNEKAVSGNRHLVADCNPCVSGSLAAPVFSSYDLASLDDSIMPLRAAQPDAATQVAVSCEL